MAAESWPGLLFESQLLAANAQESKRVAGGMMIGGDRGSQTAGGPSLMFPPAWATGLAQAKAALADTPSRLRTGGGDVDRVITN